MSLSKSAVVLIVGLGNPGVQYTPTPHNAGFWVVDALAEACSFPAFKLQGSALVSSAQGPKGRVILAKPQTFMNLSGKAVQSLMTFYKIPLENVLVIHDEVALPWGQFRVKRGGGAAGHNGLRSIDQAVGKDYYRLRIGIGPKPQERDLSSYVLSPARLEDVEKLRPLIEMMVRAASFLGEEGVGMFLKNLQDQYSQTTNCRKENES